MNIIRNLPGPLLVFMGAVSLSFGGLIVKSFEGSTLWQILFWRSIFFSLTVLVFLIISYKKKLFISFYESGLPGFFGGIILSVGFCGYVFAMYNTTVANTNFIISTQVLFLAIFGYLFLKEKISIITLASIILAISGVILMVGNSLSPGELSGNIAAFSMPITFAILIILVRKFPKVDMVPAQFVAGICCCIIGFLLSNKIMISPHDIFLGFIAGFFQVGFGFIFITIGAQTTPSALVGFILLSESILGPMWAFLFAGERPSLFTLIGGVIMLSESVLGPIWAILFVSERPSTFGLIGGAIILFAVLIQFYYLL
jgi:drug/metabolite transporter (DMT)-like permease